MSTFTSTFDFVVETCCREDCGVPFAMTTNMQRRLRNEQSNFHCPNGHPQHYTGKSDAQKLNEALAHTAELREQMRTGAARRRGMRLELVPSAAREIDNSDGTVTIQPSTCAFHPHYLRLVGRNGETLMHSENYATRSNARRAVKNLAAKLGINDVREVSE